MYYHDLLRCFEQYYASAIRANGMDVSGGCVDVIAREEVVLAEVYVALEHIDLLAFRVIVNGIAGAGVELEQHRGCAALLVVVHKWFDIDARDTGLIERLPLCFGAAEDLVLHSNKSRESWVAGRGDLVRAFAPNAGVTPALQSVEPGLDQPADADLSTNG